MSLASSKLSEVHNNTGPSAGREDLEDSGKQERKSGDDAVRESDVIAEFIIGLISPVDELVHELLQESQHRHNQGWEKHENVDVVSAEGDQLDVFVVNLGNHIAVGKLRPHQVVNVEGGWRDIDDEVGQREDPEPHGEHSGVSVGWLDDGPDSKAQRDQGLSESNVWTVLNVVEKVWGWPWEYEIVNELHDFIIWIVLLI